MAIIFVEGFDYWDINSTAPHGWVLGQTRSNAAGRWGGQSFTNSRPSGGPGIVSSVVLPSTATTMIVGWAQNGLAASSSSNFLLTTAALGSVASVRANGSNPAVYNAAGTLVATGTSGAISGWNYYELKIFVNGASGTCELYCNGVLDIASTTGNFGSTAIGALATVILAGTSLRIDDIYVADTTGPAPRNTYLGDIRVQTIMPTDAGAHTDFTPLAGSNWQNVDDALADGDTTYNYDSNPGHIDSFVTNDVTVGATVYAVQTNLQARKDDTGVRQIADLIYQGGTDYAGQTATLTSGYVFYSNIYNQDPTAADWTDTTVNADEFGYKVIV